MTLPPITPQQQLLTNLLFSFRYSTRLHLQYYLGHSNPREVNRLLQDLVKKGYVRRVGEWSRNTEAEEEDKNKEDGGGITGSFHPAIYCIGPKGIRFLAKSKNISIKELKKRYKDGGHSQAFIDHQLLLTDIFLQFRQPTLANGTKLTFQTKPDYEEGSTLARFSPDAYVIEEGLEEKKISLVEIIDIETQRFIIKRRIRSLFKIYSSNSLEVETGEDFPTILLICPTQELRGFLNNYISAIQKDQAEDLVIKLTTYQKVKVRGVKSPIWKTAKAKDEE